MWIEEWLQVMVLMEAQENVMLKVFAHQELEFSKIFVFWFIVFDRLCSWVYEKDLKLLCFSWFRGEFNLTNFHDGLLSSAFMVGLLVASPIFAGLSKRWDFCKQDHEFCFQGIRKKSLFWVFLPSIACSFNPFKLIGVGLTVWTIAATGCGFSYNFWMIAVFRMWVFFIITLLFAFFSPVSVC